MASAPLPENCHRWNPGQPTMHAPHDVVLLQAASEAGFLPFLGPAGLCGARSRDRMVLAIHRGRGAAWEVICRQFDTDVLVTKTTNLPDLTPTLVAWIGGATLSAADDSLVATVA